jgi:uncharacterized protein with HEPN domain
MTPSVRDRLGHIKDAISNIEAAVIGQSHESFTDDLTRRAAVERWFEIISEASRHLPPEISRQAPDINWRRVVDLGNWLRHAYHRTDARLLWVMVEEDLPVLKDFVGQALEKANSTS